MTTSAKNISTTVETMNSVEIPIETTPVTVREDTEKTVQGTASTSMNVVNSITPSAPNMNPSASILQVPIDAYAKKDSSHQEEESRLPALTLTNVPVVRESADRMEFV